MASQISLPHRTFASEKNSNVDIRITANEIALPPTKLLNLGLVQISKDNSSDCS